MDDPKELLDQLKKINDNPQERHQLIMELTLIEAVHLIALEKEMIKLKEMLEKK